MELKNYNTIKQLNGAEESAIEAMYNVVEIDNLVEEAKYSTIELDDTSENGIN